MTANVGEPNLYSDVAGHGYRIRQLERRPPVVVGFYEIKVFPDEGTGSETVTGDGKFIWVIPYDLDGTNLVDADAFVTTVGSGATVIQIRNITQAVDMLTTRITIDANEYHSFPPGASSPADIDDANNTVVTGDRIAIDVDTAGAGSKGLGVMLRFDQDDPYPGS
jgi:hypothetical protein